MIAHNLKTINGIFNLWKVQYANSQLMRKIANLVYFG